MIRTKLGTLLTTISTLAGLSAICFAQQPKVDPMTVCEVLERLPALENKRITVIGLFVDSDEGSGLFPARGEDCPRRYPARLVSGRQKWIDGISIDRDVRGASVKSDHAQQALDWMKLKRAPDGRLRLKVIETLSGRLELPTGLLAGQDKGAIPGQGFGSGGALRARLVYDEIVEVELQPLSGEK